MTEHNGRRPPGSLLFAEMADLAGLSEVADMLGVTTRSVQRYAERDDFPTPVEVLSGKRRIWHRKDIERWKKRHFAGDAAGLKPGPRPRH